MPRIREARKTALELLLSNHYADCLAPCKQTCPAGVDVQGYIALIAMGNPGKRSRLIKETNPLPLVCGRVCVRECEVACRRNRVDERVGIDYLKRYATDIDIEDPWTPAVPPANGKKVAVVGGGPAGLTCRLLPGAQGLRRHPLRKVAASGRHAALRHPRIPAAQGTAGQGDLLDHRAGRDGEDGLRPGQRRLARRPQEQGFDAIYLAFGAQKAKSMRLPDEETIAGVLPGIDFLWQLQSARKPEIHGKVVVVGGGNTALDAARTAHRLGAAKVTILYRRTRNEMPAHPMEIDAALEEGVELILLSAPTELVAENGRLKALTCIRMELGEPDASGRRSPVPVAGSEYRLPCDFAISAIGQDVDLCGLQKDPQLKSTRYNTLVFSEDTFETSLPGVFTGGDMATGPAVAIDAIAHGKIAANAIDHVRPHRQGRGKSQGVHQPQGGLRRHPGQRFCGLARIEKEKMPELPADARAKTFAEVELGFSGEQAANETSRCLECGCSAYFDCDLRKHAVDFGVDIDEIHRRGQEIQSGQGAPLHHPRSQQVHRLRPLRAHLLGDPARLGAGLRLPRLQVGGPALHGKKAPGNQLHLLRQLHCRLPHRRHRRETALRQARSLGREKVHRHLPFLFRRLRAAVQGLRTRRLRGGRHRRHGAITRATFATRAASATATCWTSSGCASPQVKGKAGLKEASWDEALDLAAAKLWAPSSRSTGPKPWPSSPRPGWPTKSCTCCRSGCAPGSRPTRSAASATWLNGGDLDALDDMLGFTASTTTMDEFQQRRRHHGGQRRADRGQPGRRTEDQGSDEKGARLMAVNSSENPLSRIADLWLDPRRGTNTALIAGLANALIEERQDRPGLRRPRARKTSPNSRPPSPRWTPDRSSAQTGIQEEKFAQAVDMLAAAANIVVVYGMDQCLEKSRDDLKALGNLLLLLGKAGQPGNGLVLVRDYANAQGLLDMGVDSRYLPGLVRPGQPAVDRLQEKCGASPLNRIFKPRRHGAG